MSAYSDKIIADGATAYWRLGESSGTTASDSVGTAHGTISGGVTLAQPGALADGDKAMVFNGTSGKIQTPAVAIPATCTIELWIKTTGSGSGISLVGNRYGTQTPGECVLLQYPNQLVVYVDANPISSVSVPLNNGVWHHLVWVSTGTNGQCYVDGVGSAVQSQTHAAVTEVVVIANDQYQANFFPGTLDEVAIYPTALTPQQIASHYNLGRLNFSAGSYPATVVGDGASAYWRLNESSGTTAVDVIGGNNGIISGGVTLGQAGALADGDKAMAFPGSAWIDTIAFAIPAVFTLEFWIRPTQARQHDVLATRSPDGPDTWSVELTVAGAIYLYMFSVGSSPSGSGVTLNAWHHVVFTNNGTSASTYVNGVLAGSGALAHGATAGKSLRIGGNNANNAYFIGLLDDVALYPTALTLQQIADHYEARTFANLPIIPWAVVAGAWSGPMDAYKVWLPITPHDTNDIDGNGGLTDAILVGGAGDLAAVMENKQVVVLKGLPAGAWIPIAARRVNATGTTATNLAALYQA